MITKDRAKEIALDFADTSLGAFSIAALVVCLLWILNYVLLRIAG